MADWHIAQINVARLRAPIDDPLVRDFVAGLEPINQLADASPGFIWRFSAENDEVATATGDDLLIVNMSVWRSLESLGDFVYRTAHREFLRRKRNWFDRMAEAYMALWWVEAGQRPSADEGIERLQVLRRDGPSPAAFTFRVPFPAPGVVDTGAGTDDRNRCLA
jgi:hypothetical protein